MTPLVSFIIPARNEMYVGRTVEGVLKNTKQSEVIVILDGAPADLPADERVRVVQYAESIGQRAACNVGARMARGKYICKLDAHCIISEDFDRAMASACQPDWTVIPVQYNLHAFDWHCLKCGSRWYQGPTPDRCYRPVHSDGREPNPNCDSHEFEKIDVWQPRWHKKTEGWRFDQTLKFGYWGALTDAQQGDVIETMSLLGACWFLEKDHYWQWGGSDESLGSWGQQGVEIAFNTWLRGGRLVVNRKAWFAHLFRTQGSDFSFPYPQSGRQVEHAREITRQRFFSNQWPKAVHDSKWLIDKFSKYGTIPGWEGHEWTAKEPTKGIVYYTDSQLDTKIAGAVRKQIKDSVNGHEVVSVSLAPLEFGRNIVVGEPRGILTMFKQILAGLDVCQSEIVFLCEHDVLYNDSHFAFIPPEKNVFYYNTNCWKVRAEDGHALYYEPMCQVSGLCAYRELLIEHYRKRIEKVEQEGRYARQTGYEPGMRPPPKGVDYYTYETWRSEIPLLDIRHSTNLSKNRWDISEFRNKSKCLNWTEAESVAPWYEAGKFGELLELLNG